MVVKVSCPECEEITEYTGEVKKGKLITCSNPKCKYPSGKRRRIKVIPNMILSDTSDTNEIDSEILKESKKEQDDTEVTPEKAIVIPSDTKKKTHKNNIEIQRSKKITKNDTMIPSDTKGSVSRIIEILRDNLDIKTGFFWDFHQTMSTRRSFSNKNMTKFQKICLELKMELDKIDKNNVR